MPRIGTIGKGLTSRDGLWLAIAVLLHAVLLLVPIRHEPAVELLSDRPLVIKLDLESIAKSPFVQQAPPSASPPAEPVEPELLPEQPEPPPDPIAEITVQDGDETPDIATLSAEPAPALSTAVLLQSATDHDWPLPMADSSRKLGVFIPRKAPENWRPTLRLEDNLFNGMTAPRKVEIVDRWSSPDGSHNVVINTPAGDTFCGRGRAWDPMQPLVEHVMQFRPCGGGGKRTFEMPDRYRRNAENGGIANSTTN